jgi:hypothetical protein
MTETMLNSESFRLAMVPMACSSWARATPTSIRCARTVSSREFREGN